MLEIKDLSRTPAVVVYQGLGWGGVFLDTKDMCRACVSWCRFMVLLSQKHSLFAGSKNS